MTKFLLFSQALSCLDYLRFPPGLRLQMKEIKRRRGWLWSSRTDGRMDGRTTITYHIQTVCTRRYRSPGGCWPRSDTCRCPFCWARWWSTPCPPRSCAQCRAALLHLWTTAPGPVWGTKDKRVFASYTWRLCKCPYHVNIPLYFNWNSRWQTGSRHHPDSVNEKSSVRQTHGLLWGR